MSDQRIANLESALYHLQVQVVAQHARIHTLESVLLSQQGAAPTAEPERRDENEQPPPPPPQRHDVEEANNDAAGTGGVPAWAQDIMTANPTAQYVRKEDLAETLCLRKGVSPHPHIGSVRWRVPSAAGPGVALKVIPHILERAAAVYGLVIEASTRDIAFSDDFMDGASRSFEVYVAYSVKSASDVQLRNGAVMAKKAGHPAVDIVHLDACLFEADKPHAYVIITADGDFTRDPTFYNQVSASLEARLGLLCHSQAYPWEVRSMAFDVWSPDGRLPTAEKVHDALWHIAGVQSVSFEAAAHL